MGNNSSQIILVKDNVTGFTDNGYTVNPKSSFPKGPTEFDGKLYFSINDRETGRELWVSDGTEAGTTLVKDINPTDNSYAYAADYYSPKYLTEVDGKLYFSANDGENGRELWVSDGTAEGTTLVKDINPGSDRDGNAYSSEIRYFTEANDKLYFTADDGENGRELWVTDGTEAGTTLVKDINPGSDSYGNPNTSDINRLELIEFQDKLYFAADDGENGSELWVSDGTEAGTTLFKDFSPGSGNYGANSSFPDDFVEFEDKLYFFASTETGRQLWVSDGTAEGTNSVADISPGNLDSAEFTEVNGKLYFSGDDGENGSELWVTDGTTEGTKLLVDINPGINPYGYPNTSNPSYLTAFNDKLYFAANDGETGTELWVSDGTVEGTKPVADINPDPNDRSYLYDAAAPADFVEFRGKLYFTARDGYSVNDAGSGRELWVTDGTTEGTKLVADINPGTDDSFALYVDFTVVGDELFFRADDGENGAELYKLAVDDDITEISGTDDADSIAGGDSNDLITGLDGNDSLVGGNGDDTLIGSAGDDILTGGNGRDVFVIESNAGIDKIVDFDLERDRLGLSDGLEYKDLTFVGQDIRLGDATLATLANFDTSYLTESDFFAV